MRRLRDGFRRQRPPILAVTLLLAGLAGCGGEPQYTQPNALWVVCDSARADRQALCGHHRPTPPHLYASAAEAHVYE